MAGPGEGRATVWRNRGGTARGKTPEGKEKNVEKQGKKKDGGSSGAVQAGRALHSGEELCGRNKRVWVPNKNKTDSKEGSVAKTKRGRSS